MRFNQKRLKLSWNGNECKPLLVGPGAAVRGAWSRKAPSFGSGSFDDGDDAESSGGEARVDGEAGVFFENEPSTDDEKVEYLPPPSRDCMSIHTRDMS